MRKSKLAILGWSAGLVLALASCGGGSNTTSSDSKDSGSASNTTSSVESSSAGDSSVESSEASSSAASSSEEKKAKTGISSLIGASASERTEILGTLEKYAVDNMITGMPLFENGGYVCYNNRVVKGTNTYITGYGFGILRDGRLTTALTDAEVVKKDYYNTYDVSDPATINALNANGSQVSDLYDYIASGYFGTKMNAHKNGYDWYGVLSTKDRPYIVKNGTASYPDDPEATSDTWRVYVRTGREGGVAYHTNSSLENRKAFDGKFVELEDYVTAFKVLLCKKFGYYRGTELAKQSGYAAIKGASEYNSGTAAGIDDELFAEKVGVKSGHDDEGDYLDFTLGAPANRFYAMYSLAGNLYAPINLDFFNLVTDNGANPKNYGGYDSNKTTSPVDNILSTSVWTLESWETDKGIAFKRNDDWWEKKENSQLYSIPGVYINIYTAASKDPNFAFQQFLAGRIDAAGIPLDYIDEYKNDERATKTTGTSVFKLNVNSCSQEEWNDLFGDSGSIAQLGDNSYEVKPWMSNENFIKGMFFSIDRDAYAAKRGSIASTNYFSSNYMSDPENGISYNTTEEHKNALADFWGDTLATGGYSEALSKEAFNQAITELLAANTIKDNDKLTIDAWWMYPSHLKNYAPDIEEYIETAFNNASAAKEHNLKLDVVSQSVDVWSDVYDKHLQVGKFDLGFGSISGNALDPLNFMEVLKSDNSSGFTLNWGKDTSALDLEYKGELWSFNTLWAAVDHGVVTYKGVEAKAAEILDATAKFEDDKLVVEYAYRDGKEILAGYDDEDSDALLQIPEDQWSLEVKDTWLSFNVGNYGVDMAPDGLVYDIYGLNEEETGYAYYQELYTIDEEGVPQYLIAYEDDEEVMDLGECWATVEANVTERGDEVVGAELSIELSGGVAAYFARTGQVAVTVDMIQFINGVESAITVVKTIPIVGAPTAE